MCTLRTALTKLSPPTDKILTLPIAHLTSLDSFRRTIGSENSSLNPKYCNVFAKKLLYFSYGSVFHRYKQSPTDKAGCLPVSLLFKPQLLDEIDCFYPYDTGAARKGMYSPFTDDLIQFDRYRIPNRDSQLPSKFIHYVYGCNQKYLRGEAILQDNAIFTEPLITLINFLRFDLTDNNVDHRQRAIECQTSKKINLRSAFNQIIWVGLPEREKYLYNKIDELSSLNRNHEIRKFFYRYRRAQRPDEIAAILEKEAGDIVQEYLAGAQL